MRRIALTALALTAMIAVPAYGGVQQTTEAQRRELEKKVTDLQSEVEALKRELMRREDGSRIRVESAPRVSVTPRAFRMAPGMTMFTNRPKFGFTMSNVPDTAGVKVTAVTPGAPAEKSGLRSGDIVTMFNGVKLTGLEEPYAEVLKQGENIEVGDTVAVEFKRGTERKRVQMVAAELASPKIAEYWSEPGHPAPEPDQMRVPAEFFELGRIPGTWLDVELVAMNRDLGDYFGATEGVLVLRAPKDSSLGLKAGDVVQSIGGRKVTNPSQALRILRSYENGETFEISVLRKKARVNVSAKVPERDRGYFSWDGGDNERQ